MNPKLETLKNKRLECNMSIRDIASKLNISKSMYSYIENGDKRLSYDMAISIADIFNMSPDQLFYQDFDNYLKDTII